MILCKKGYPEDIVSYNPEFIFSSGPVGHSEVDVDFAVYYMFAKSRY